MSYSRNDYSNDDILRQVKAVCISVLAGALICSALFMLSAWLFSVLNISPNNVLSVVCLSVCIISSFCGGWLATKINKKNGLILGSIVGLVLFVPLFLIGAVAFGSEISFLSLTRALAMVLSGAIGGILGVNQKKKEKF